MGTPVAAGGAALARVGDHRRGSGHGGERRVGNHHRSRPQPAGAGGAGVRRLHRQAGHHRSPQHLSGPGALSCRGPGNRGSQSRRPAFLPGGSTHDLDGVGASAAGRGARRRRRAERMADARRGICRRSADLPAFRPAGGRRRRRRRAISHRRCRRGRLGGGRPRPPYRDHRAALACLRRRVRVRGPRSALEHQGAEHRSDPGQDHGLRRHRQVPRRDPRHRRLRADDVEHGCRLRCSTAAWWT